MTEINSKTKYLQSCSQNGNFFRSMLSKCIQEISMSTKRLISGSCSFFIAWFCFSMSACNKSSSDDKKTAGTTTNEYLSSYEAVDGCTTKQHVFKANSEEEIANAVCSALKDENLNNSCAAQLRNDLFTYAACKGIFPTVTVAVGTKSKFRDSYGYQENACSTGVHFFYATTESKVLELFCKALKNDELNRNCAKLKREESFKDNDCVKHAIAKPEDNTAAAPTVPPKEEVKNESNKNSPFSCYHEKNICDEKTQYCLISKDANGNRNTDECLSLPTDCKDDDCIVESAKLRFCKDGNPKNCTDNCKAGTQIVRKNDQLTVICNGPPQQKYY